MLLCDLTLIF